MLFTNTGYIDVLIRLVKQGKTDWWRVKYSPEYYKREIPNMHLVYDELGNIKNIWFSNTNFDFVFGLSRKHTAFEHKKGSSVRCYTFKYIATDLIFNKNKILIKLVEDKE